MERVSDRLIVLILAAISTRLIYLYGLLHFL